MFFVVEKLLITPDHSTLAPGQTKATITILMMMSMMMSMMISMMMIVHCFTLPGAETNDHPKIVATLIILGI